MAGVPGEGAEPFVGFAAQENPHQGIAEAAGCVWQVFSVVSGFDSRWNNPQGSKARVSPPLHGNTVFNTRCCTCDGPSIGPAAPCTEPCSLRAVSCDRLAG